MKFKRSLRTRKCKRLITETLRNKFQTKYTFFHEVMRLDLARAGDFS